MVAFLPSTMNLREKIRVIPDFPKEGISFKDITTLLKDPQAFQYAIKKMADHFRDKDIHRIIGIESRGFILGAPLAYEMGLGFSLIRKPGKLPGSVMKVEYALEYGNDSLEMHADDITEGTRVLLVDDLLATGGTIGAAAQLVEQQGGSICGLGFLIELLFLEGRKRLENYPIFSLVEYEE